MIETLITALFTYDNMIIIGGLIGMGYFLNRLENVPNRRISSIQTVFALHICLFKVQNPIDAICVAFILAGLAQILYSTVLSNIQEVIVKHFGGKEEPSPTAPRMITPPILMACFFMQACANLGHLPPNATPEEKRAAALADTREALSSKRNQAIAEVLISEAGKYAVSTVKDKVDKEAIKTQLRGCGDAGLSLLFSGKEITPDQMRAVFSVSSLTSKLDAEKFSKQFNSAFSPIQDYIDEASQANDPKIARDWFALICRASIKAGS